MYFLSYFAVISIWRLESDSSAERDHFLLWLASIFRQQEDRGSVGLDRTALFAGELRYLGQETQSTGYRSPENCIATLAIGCGSWLGSIITW